MQSVRRRLFAIVSVLSPIFFLTTVGLWVRRYWRLDQVHVEFDTAQPEHQTAIGLWSCEGECALICHTLHHKRFTSKP